MRSNLAVERLGEGHWHPLPDARRAEAASLAREIRLVGESPVITALLDAVDAILLVLNTRRQVVSFNGPGPREELLARVGGLRPGELLACVNASAPAGCGTLPACESCGALGAILESKRAGRPVEAEARLRTAGGAAAWEFNVRATPVEVGGEPFTVVSLRDVSAERRREALEQIFFHDVLNTVSALRSWAGNLGRPGVPQEKVTDRVATISRQLEREIVDHRAVVEAERGTLSPTFRRVAVATILADLAELYASHGVAKGRTVEVTAPPSPLELTTDLGLLSRVLGNMLKNALEATPEGGVVRIGASPSFARGLPGVRFSIHNAGEMPREVQARVFERSFSTKATRGRGLGTWSMKLLGERYLGGEVSFTSTAAGTTFTFVAPAAPAGAFA